jgi:hypothetical protein
MSESYLSKSDAPPAANEQPPCNKCDGRMSMARIAPGRSGFSTVTFRCNKCLQVVEIWLDAVGAPLDTQRAQSSLIRPLQWATATVPSRVQGRRMTFAGSAMTSARSAKAKDFALRDLLSGLWRSVSELLTIGSTRPKNGLSCRKRLALLE